MNRDNAKLYLPLVQALADGKTIQFRAKEDSPWYTQTDGNLTFLYAPEQYRIKPEPQKVHAVVRQDGSIAQHFFVRSNAEAEAGKWNMEVGEKAYTVKTFVLVEENNDGNC